MAQKLVRTLHDRLKIIEDIEKNPGENRVDIAKQLGLPASTLNTIFAKKNDIREQIQKCGNACKNEKLARSLHLLNWKLCSSRRDLRSFRKS
jgi:predicted transcriptional regulator